MVISIIWHDMYTSRHQCKLEIERRFTWQLQQANQDDRQLQPHGRYSYNVTLSSFVSGTSWRTGLRLSAFDITWQNQCKRTKTTKAKRPESTLQKYELVMSSSSHIGIAGSMQISGGTTNNVIIKSVVIPLLLNCQAISVLAKKAVTIWIKAQVYIPSPDMM